MRVQLDTINKTITIEEDVNLHDFYEEINGLLPGGLWREYTLKITKITKWNGPIIQNPNTTTPYHPFPGQPSPLPGIPQIWYGTSTNNMVASTTSNTTNGDIPQGVFNFEM